MAYCSRHFPGHLAAARRRDPTIRARRVHHLGAATVNLLGTGFYP